MDILEISSVITIDIRSYDVSSCNSSSKSALQCLFMKLGSKIHHPRRF